MQLTADLVARAVIAAARSYGDDPVRAMTALRGLPRRSLTPAALGVGEATGAPFPRVARMLGLRGDNPSRSAGAPGFEKAKAAAAEAVRWSLAAAADLARADPSTFEPQRPAEEQAEPEVEPPVREPIPIRTAAEGLMRMRRAGPISAPIAPPPPPLKRPLGPAGERLTTELVLEALAAADGPVSSMGLATLIDRKEMAVVGALSQLASEGRAESLPVTGPRKLGWRLTEKGRAAA